MNIRARIIERAAIGEPVIFRKRLTDLRCAQLNDPALHANHIPITKLSIFSNGQRITYRFEPALLPSYFVAHHSHNLGYARSSRLV